MKTVLIAYLSRTGQTEKMALLIAEGCHKANKKVHVRKLNEINTAEDVELYDGLVFGCPTYFRTIPDGMKHFLFKASALNLAGKVGGAFGSYLINGESGDIIYEVMQHVFKMKMIDSGVLKIKVDLIEKENGIKSCQDYGKGIADLLE